MDADTFDLPIAVEDELTLNIDGWEGPLDLLLNLARAQKVDLAAISILELVEQYLAYISGARALKLEIAADYLVMAAWLAYLKSCLLLPKDPEADPSAEEIALRLQMRLQRLDAMREAGARLMGRDRIGRDVFVRGAPEGLRLVRKSAWQARAFDLFAAYGTVKARATPPLHVVHPRSVMTLEEAIDARRARCSERRSTGPSSKPSSPRPQDPQFRRSALASSFVAALELARRGRLDIAQDEAFAPILLQDRVMDEFVRAVEATLFASATRSRPRRSPHMSARATSRLRLTELAGHYGGRGIELVERGGRWHFQTAPDLAHLLRRTREEPRRLSRAATETLAIIAYHEPVSRAEIEAIRGVQISKGTLDVLMDAGWVRAAGRREGPGRPLLYATTGEFLTAFRPRLAPRPAGDRRPQGRGPARPARRKRRAVAWRTATGKRGRGGLEGAVPLYGVITWAVSVSGISLSSRSSCCCCSAAIASRR